MMMAPFTRKVGHFGRYFMQLCNDKHAQSLLGNRGDLMPGIDGPVMVVSLSVLSSTKKPPTLLY